MARSGYQTGSQFNISEYHFMDHISFIDLLFKKELHEQFGFYSKNFSIAADSLFVIQACKGQATRCNLEFIAGEIGTDGVSAIDWAGSATELFRVQLITGESVITQTLLLVVRIIKGASSLARAAHNALSRE